MAVHSEPCTINLSIKRTRANDDEQRRSNLSVDTYSDEGKIRSHQKYKYSKTTDSKTSLSSHQVMHFHELLLTLREGGRHYKSSSLLVYPLYLLYTDICKDTDSL